MKLEQGKNLEEDKNFSKHILKPEDDLKIMAHETVNFRRNNYSVQIATDLKLYIWSYKVIHILFITKLHNNTIDSMYKIQ